MAELARVQAATKNESLYLCCKCKAKDVNSFGILAYVDLVLSHFLVASLTFLPISLLSLFSLYSFYAHTVH